MEPLTPNHLLTMKSDSGVEPAGWMGRTEGIYSRKRWRQVQHLASLFWTRWRREYMRNLQIRQKWLRPRRNVQKGDIVLLVDEAVSRAQWSLAIVQDVESSSDKIVRAVTVKTSKGAFRRPITKIVLLIPVEEQ